MARFVCKGAPSVSRCGLGSRPPPGRQMAAPPPPSRGNGWFLWGLGGCKSHARRLPFAPSPPVMPFAGAKISGSLARAARWLPAGEEPSPQRDTDGEHQKKAYEQPKFEYRTSPSERRPDIIMCRPGFCGGKGAGRGHARGVSAVVAVVGSAGCQSRSVGRV